jgi:hypothetical protein
MLRHPKLAFILIEVCLFISRCVPNYVFRKHIVVSAHEDSLESTEKLYVYVLVQNNKSRKVNSKIITLQDMLHIELLPRCH